MIWLFNHFHMQLLALELLFCMHLKKRPYFWLRFVPLAVLYAVLPILVEGGFKFKPLVIGGIPFGFLFMFIFSLCILRFCFQISLKQLVFYGCLSHTFQHLGHCFSRLCLSLFPGSNDTVMNLTLLAVTVVLCLLILRIRGSFIQREPAELTNRNLLFFALGSTAIVYVISVSNPSPAETPIGMVVLDFFACVLILCILLDAFRLRSAEQNRLIMERMLRQEQEQHRISQATLEVINRKCHDMKHQIAALRHMSEEEKEKSIAGLEKDILIYDHFPKSGLEKLDIILAEKSMLAEQQHISLDCIIDGSRLSFVSTADLYSLLGNALDNAIEATSKQPEGTPRIITLHGAAKGDLYSIHIDNPCLEAPTFNNGLPVTDKSDKNYHGFGTQSIQYLCDKYSGIMKVSWEEGFFNLDILLPLKSLKAS